MNDKIKALLAKAYKTDSIAKNKWRIENREQLREQRKKELKELMEKDKTMSNNKQSIKMHRTTTAILLLILLLGWAIAKIDAVFYSVLILSVLGIMYAFIYLGIVRNTGGNNEQQ